MKRFIQHIFCIVLLLLLSIVSSAQSDGYNEMLDRYEALCSQCLELRNQAASGESVSREKIKNLLDNFLSLNKLLKSCEGDMTVEQRRRFVSIGKWFSEGGELKRELEPLAELSSLSSVCILDSMEMPLDIIVESQIEEPETLVPHKYYALLTLAFPDDAVGVMTGYQYGRWGGYVSFRSNFVFGQTSYECASDGRLASGGTFWGTGDSRKKNLSACIGGLVQVHDLFSVYAGAGYGVREMDWKDIDGNWVEVSDWSHKSIAVESGVVFSSRKLAITAGLSTVKFKTLSFTCGIGVKF